LERLRIDSELSFHFCIYWVIQRNEF